MKNLTELEASLASSAPDAKSAPSDLVRALSDKEYDAVSGGDYSSNGAGVHSMSGGNYYQTGGQFAQQNATSYIQSSGRASASVYEEQQVIE